MQDRQVITLRRRPRWARVLYAPKHFWIQMRIGAGRVKLTRRLEAAYLLTKLFIRKDKDNGSR